MKEKTYDELFFTDDFLFSKIMRDPEIAKGVVENLLGIKVRKIKFLNSQYSINEVYNGRGVRLDAYLEDSDKIIDVEMQTVIKKDEGLRMRYYQSIIDVEHLSSGKTYNELKESYVVFLCLKDPFGQNQPVYDFILKDKNGETVLNDKVHKVIYNANCFEKVDNKNIRALLAFLKTRKPSDNLTTKIQSAINISKNHQPWRAEYMLWKDQILEWKQEAREEGLAEGLAEGREAGLAEGREAGLAEGREAGLAEGREAGLAEGRTAGITTTALNMISKGYETKEISAITGMTEEEIDKLRK